MRPFHDVTAPGRSEVRTGRLAAVAKPVGRFGAHALEMCMVMCAGAIVLSLLFFEGAALLGYADVPSTAPALSAFVIAVNLSLPMTLWMRHRGMAWRPTLEMAASTMVTGLVLIAAYWVGLAPKGSLIEIQTSLACPLMIAVMLLRFPLYSAQHAAHHARAA